GGAAPAAAGLAAKSGSTRLRFALDGKTLVTGEALAALYHQTERGMGGFFPLGDAGLFHSGAHLRPERNTPILAVADGEVVAARLGSAPGEHAWGDTGFVILRHVLKGDKKVYSLVMHLRREPLHPDRTAAPWLKRLLVGAMTEKEDGKRPRWRVSATLPTRKDEDKGNFSPANVQNDVKLEPGVYEEEEELTKDQRRYVKLKGKWIRAAGQ